LRQGQYVGTQVFGSLEQGSPLKACSTVGIGHNDHCGYLTAMRWIYIYIYTHIFIFMYVYTHTQSFHISCTLLYLQIWPAGAGAVPVWTSGVEGYRNSEARWDETVRSNKINKSGRLKMRQDLDKVKSRFWRARPDQATPRGDCLHRSWQVWYVPLCTAAREGQTGLQTLSKEDYTYCPVRLIKSEGGQPHLLLTHHGKPPRGGARQTMVLKCIVYYDFLRQRRQFPG
jgi:hypothetical protein